MKILRHILTVALALLLLAGVPVFATGYFQKKLLGMDAVSSASTIIEQPSEAYVVMINRDRHKNADDLSTWESFFRGEEIDYLFDDISCLVPDMDTVGLELARSFQSRLPENQMKVRTEDITLIYSKAQYGLYDVVLVSREIYDLFGGNLDNGNDRNLLIEAEGV